MANAQKNQGPHFFFLRKAFFSEIYFLKALSLTMIGNSVEIKMKYNFCTLSPPLLIFSIYFIKFCSHLPNFLKVSFSLSKKREQKTMCIHLKIQKIVSDSFCVFSLEHFDIFGMFLLLLAVLNMIFCKDFPGQNFTHFYNQIKLKAGNRLHPPNKNKNTWKLFKAK